MMSTKEESTFAADPGATLQAFFARLETRESLVDRVVATLPRRWQETEATVAEIRSVLTSCGMLARR